MYTWKGTTSLNSALDAVIYAAAPGGGGGARITEIPLVTGLGRPLLGVHLLAYAPRERAFPLARTGSVSPSPSLAAAPRAWLPSLCRVCPSSAPGSLCRAPATSTMRALAPWALRCPGSRARSPRPRRVQLLDLGVVVLHGGILVADAERLLPHFGNVCKL